MRPASFALWIALAACAGGRAFPALAWGDEAHRIICAVALDLLEAPERREVERLTRLYRRPDGVRYTDFPGACTLADLARGRARAGARGWSRFERFQSWHFVNVPRETRRIQAKYCAGNCVLDAIEYHAKRCADVHLTEWKRAEALLLLGHWVGDVHQPLHVSYLDDRGGNEVGPIRGGYYRSANLHLLWDTGIVDRALAGGDWRAYARRLHARISPALRSEWAGGGPVAWAQESYEITTSAEMDYCEWTRGGGSERCAPELHARKLDAAYQERFQGVMDRQLQRAAVRLAERVRGCLAR